MLNDIVQKYLKLFPQDKAKLGILLEQIKRGDDLNDRKNYYGHITGGAIILSPDMKKVLMVYHPTHQRWLQPGGHWDPPEKGPWQSSEREAIEETGVKIAKRVNVDKDYRVPLNIDSHIISTTPPLNEPKHLHHDFRYGFVAVSSDLNLEDDVIKEAKWIKINDPKAGLLRVDINRLLSLLKA